MSGDSRKRRTLRTVLIIILTFAVLVLAAAFAFLVPILVHTSAGGSGQEVPEGFVAETAATGEDGRTRALSVIDQDGQAADLAQLREGQQLTVRGTGYDSSIGIYVSICAVPSVAGDKPSPCLGGVPEGATSGEMSDEVASSAWVTDNWAWRAFATKGYDVADTGSFEVQIVVPPATQESLDCSQVLCAVTTRADHTASADRVQDMQLPVRFVE